MLLCYRPSCICRERVEGSVCVGCVYCLCWVCVCPSVQLSVCPCYPCLVCLSVGPCVSIYLSAWRPEWSKFSVVADIVSGGWWGGGGGGGGGGGVVLTWLQGKKKGRKEGRKESQKVEGDGDDDEQDEDSCRWGDMVAQLVRASCSRPGDPEVWTRIRNTRRRKSEFFPLKNVVCWLAVGVPNPRVCMHTWEWSFTHVKDPDKQTVNSKWLTDWLTWVAEQRKDVPNWHYSFR